MSFVVTLFPTRKRDVCFWKILAALANTSVLTMHVYLVGLVSENARLSVETRTVFDVTKGDQNVNGINPKEAL